MSTNGTPATYRFGEFEVDLAAYELRRRGNRIRLTRQPMDLLLLLLERHRSLVSREDIVARLWGPDVHVDADAGIHTAILKIRQVLGDSRESPQFVETVSGRGYRFIAPVEVMLPPPLAASAVLPPAPERSANRARHNLPEELTSFVGRRQQLLELQRVLASSRCVSLVGAGGVGKTRLAVRLARDLANECADGVWLVDLASLSAPDLVTQAIATAVGVRERPQCSVREALLDSLRCRQLLLVLDNCEHLIASCADVVEYLLRGTLTLRILSTSREALGVSGEVVCRVPSLSLPEAMPSVPVAALACCEATQLFIERARAVDSAFMPTPENADAIAQICSRLDGIPLAIELAAARVVLLSPQQIEARLHDRFRLLTGGARTAVARQRTLEATVEWSYQLLSDDERELLNRLSVFPATWTLDAAENVCGGDGLAADDILDLLSTLVAKSLVGIDSDVAGERRYRLLETVRAYAHGRLMQAGAADRLRERHSAVFFERFRDAQTSLRGHDQLPYIRQLHEEQENVRAALGWALSSAAGSDQGVELAGALFWFWTKRGQFHEGELWLRRAVAAAVHSPGRIRARAIIGLAHMLYFQGRHAETAARVGEALSLGRQLDDAWVVSVALFMQALIAFELGDHHEAVARAQEALAVANAGGDASERGGPLLILGNVALVTGDHARAQELYDESIEVHRRAGEKWGLSMTLSIAAGLRIVREDFEQARSQASEAMLLCEELEDPRGIAWTLDMFAALLAARRHNDGAARLWGAADALLESTGGSLAPIVSRIRDRYLETVRVALGEESFATACREGRAMPPASAIALARRQALLLC